MLSKSDFLLANSCPKKLIYKKRGYPTANDTNQYMQMLAEGGYAIGSMAKLLFPEGKEVEGNNQEAVLKTTELLKQRDCVLFEAAFFAGNKIVRTDILIKEGTEIHLIEVKSKSQNSEDERRGRTVIPEELIDDVAFQYLVIKEAYPEFSIKCSLLLPDKAKRTIIDGLAGWFIADKNRNTDFEIEELPAQSHYVFQKPSITFKYNNHPDRESYIKQLKIDGILEFVDITERIILKQPNVKELSEKYLKIIEKGNVDSKKLISKGCKGCEFNPSEKKDNGFRECWGKMADVHPNIFELNQGGRIGSSKQGWYLDELISNRKVSLYDIDSERLKKKDGTFGKIGARQLLQIENTKTNKEWISTELKPYLKTLKYPLHFIDFETYTGAIPFFKGMRPYEHIAFQWSCHTIEKPGDVPVHTEWIQTNSDFPNFEFAKSLKKQIGNSGTPLMWATHENTILRTILDQMDIFGYENESLKHWLINITKDTDRPGRLVDMNAMAFDYYFHPYMKRKTSIKKVLPAIWNHYPYLHKVPWFKDYAANDFEGGIIDPYDTLAKDIGNAEEEDVVKEGTAAMRAYYRILFDNNLTHQQKEEIKRQLLAYCKLDTMAMVIIAHHWGLK